MDNADQPSHWEVWGKGGIGVMVYTSSSILPYPAGHVIKSRMGYILVISGSGSGGGPQGGLHIDGLTGKTPSPVSSPLPQLGGQQ